VLNCRSPQLCPTTTQVQRNRAAACCVAAGAAEGGAGGLRPTCICCERCKVIWARYSAYGTCTYFYCALRMHKYCVLYVVQETILVLCTPTSRPTSACFALCNYGTDEKTTPTNHSAPIPEHHFYSSSQPQPPATLDPPPVPLHVGFWICPLLSRAQLSCAIYYMPLL